MDIATSVGVRAGDFIRQGRHPIDTYQPRPTIAWLLLDVYGSSVNLKNTNYALNLTIVNGGVQK